MAGHARWRAVKRARCIQRELGPTEWGAEVLPVCSLWGRATLEVAILRWGGKCIAAVEAGHEWH